MEQVTFFDPQKKETSMDEAWKVTGGAPAQSPSKVLDPASRKLSPDQTQNLLSQWYISFSKSSFDQPKSQLTIISSDDDSNPITDGFAAQSSKNFATSTHGTQADPLEVPGPTLQNTRVGFVTGLWELGLEVNVHFHTNESTWYINFGIRSAFTGG